MVPDLATPKRVHVVAVGGAAMSAIAYILQASGHIVSGSDEAPSPILERLRAMGCVIWVGHHAEHVRGSDLVVISTAVQASNPERAAAESFGIPIATRADMMEALGRLRRTVAISGTHGKTTTSAMAAQVFVDVGFDPSFIVGGQIRRFDGGVRWVNSPWLVVEADESDSSFLRFGAEAVIVTNIEADHLDHHATMEGLEAAFDKFVRQATGPRVVCVDDPGCRALRARIDGVGSSLRSRDGYVPIITYGTAPNADVRITDVNALPLGSQFVLDHGGSRTAVAIRVPGLHNVRNATAVFAMAVALGGEPEAAAASLAGFEGVGRRFERRGEAGGVTFVDDYAHLPSEVAATVLAAAQGGWSRVVAVFQPHRYTRVRDVGRDFATSFDGADVVVVTELYAAGQEPIAGIDARVVSQAIRRSRPALDVRDTSSRVELVELLAALLRPGDLCLTMNAGDLTTLPDTMLSHPALAVPPVS